MGWGRARQLSTGLDLPGFWEVVQLRKEFFFNQKFCCPNHSFQQIIVPKGTKISYKEKPTATKIEKTYSLFHQIGCYRHFYALFTVTG